MIKDLKIRNWKSHQESQFEFGKGTNVLVGIMGSGKSSVLSAISFALFGTFPELRSREVTLDGVIMRKPEKKDKASVELTFEKNDNEFKIKRIVERGKGTTEANIQKNGEVLDSGASRTTELVEKHLKIDYELFSRAVYSEQDGIDYFLEIPKGQRMKRIDNLLKIDRFEECRSNTTTLINRISDKNASQMEIVNKMKEDKNLDKIKDLKSEIKNIKDKTDKLKDKLEKKSKTYKEIKEAVKNTKRGLEEIKNLENKKSNLQGVISNIKKDIKSLDEEIELSRNQIEGKIDEVESNLEEKKNEKDRKNTKKDNIDEELQQRKIKIQNLQDKVQKLKDVEGKCPVCDSQITGKYKKKLLDKRRERISKINEKRRELKDEVGEIKKEINELGEDIEKVQDSKVKLQRKLEKLKKIEDKKEELSTKKDKLRNIKKKLTEKKEKFKEEKIEKKRAKLEELSGEKSEIKTEIKSNKKFIKEREKRLEELKQKKEKLEKYKTKIKESREINEELKKFRNALKITQEQLRKKFIEAVNRTLRKIWDDLYPYNNFSNVRLTIKEGDYELQFKNENSWQSVEGTASGGERTSACLALRVAFALVLAPNIRWLILDEPTHNLDSKTIEDLSELLRKNISKLVDQVFLITHDEGMKSAANSYLYKLERDKGNNEPTEVNDLEQQFTSTTPP